MRERDSALYRMSHSLPPGKSERGRHSTLCPSGCTDTKPGGIYSRPDKQVALGHIDQVCRSVQIGQRGCLGSPCRWSVSRCTEQSLVVCPLENHRGGELLAHSGAQALPMMWDFAEIVP